MYIISDSLEDSAERIGQFRDEVEVKAPNKKKRIEIEPLPVFDFCPLCGEKFLSDNELDQHILVKYANNRAYLRAGSVVLRNLAIFNKAPTTLKAVLVGIDKATITINQGEGWTEPIQAGQETDLIPYLSDPILGIIRLKVDFSDGSRKYNLIVGKTADFNHEEVDKHALKSLFLPLHQREKPQWANFASIYFVPGKHPVERQYAAGLYDYPVTDKRACELLMFVKGKKYDQMGV